MYYGVKFIVDQILNLKVCCVVWLTHVQLDMRDNLGHGQPWSTLVNLGQPWSCGESDKALTRVRHPRSQGLSRGCVFVGMLGIVCRHGLQMFFS